MYVICFSWCLFTTARWLKNISTIIYCDLYRRKNYQEINKHLSDACYLAKHALKERDIRDTYNPIYFQTCEPLNKLLRFTGHSPLIANDFTL